MLSLGLVVVSVLAGVQGAHVLDSTCLQHNRLYLDELQKGTGWAARMFDSSTKLPDGLLYGNIKQLGNFDECLDVRAPNFQGKYCQASVRLIALNQTAASLYTTVARSLSWAVCVPSSCAAADVEQLVNLLVPALTNTPENTWNVSATIRYENCHVQNEIRTLEVSSIVALVLILLLVVLVLGATLFELFSSKTRWPVVRAFGARGTLVGLFSIKNEPGSLGCLHGMRVASVLWIILLHRFSNYAFGPSPNSLIHLPQKLSAVWFQGIANGHLAVDTFLFMSGLLMCYITLQASKFRALNFYLYRYLRLAMPMLAVILFQISVLPYPGEGPYWKQHTIRMAEICKNQWWINAFFIQNFVNMKTPVLCLRHTWYLAVDMQLAWLSPLVLVPLRKWPRHTLCVTTLLVIVSCFIPFTITYINKYPWSNDLLKKVPVEGNGFFVHIYMATYSRATPYLVGLLTAGYTLWKFRPGSVALSRKVVALGWFLSSAICLAVIYTLSIAYQPDYVYNRVDAAFYAGFHRLGWSLGLAWMVMACVLGYGGPVNSLLSWGPLQPLGRLGYGAYLTQFILFDGEIGSMRNPVYFSDYNILHGFFGDLPMMFFMAFILYTLVESPTMCIIRMAFKEDSNTGEVTDSKEIVMEDSSKESSNVYENNIKNIHEKYIKTIT